jgi:Fe-S-cluster containining protein
LGERDSTRSPLRRKNRQRGKSTSQEKINAAHILTKDFDFDTRDQHPTPCPLLHDDVCSIYAFRPTACRLAASADAAICARAYHNLSNENIPMPMIYMSARANYAIAFAVALKHAQLPHRAYEFNAALARAMERKDAEQAWLGGEDVFSGVLQDPNDPFSNPQAIRLYQHVFV